MIIMDINVNILLVFLIGIVIAVVIFIYQKQKIARKKYLSEVQAVRLKLIETGYEEELVCMKIEELEAMYMKFVDTSELTYKDKVEFYAKNEILVNVLEGLGSAIDELELRSFEEDF